MSLACFVVLEEPIAGFDPMVNGKSLGHCIGALDAECEDLGTRPITSFVSMEAEELKAFLVGEGLGDLAESAQEEWFEPRECLPTIDALIAIVPQRPNLSDRAEAVVEDLQEIRAVLEKAEEAGVRFHLQYDY